MILTLDSWYKPEYIMDNAKIVYARRENEDGNTERIRKKINSYRERFGADVIELNAPVLEISSTEIRQSLNGGKCEYLSQDVLKYIENNSLYKDR